jgi:hypothetical protein
MMLCHTLLLRRHPISPLLADAGDQWLVLLSSTCLAGCGGPDAWLVQPHTASEAHLQDQRNLLMTLPHWSTQYKLELGDDSLIAFVLHDTTLNHRQSRQRAKPHTKQNCISWAAELTSTLPDLIQSLQQSRPNTNWNQTPFATSRVNGTHWYQITHAFTGSGPLMHVDHSSPTVTVTGDQTDVSGVHTSCPPTT